VGDAYDIIKDLCSQNTTTVYLFPGRAKRGRWGSYRSAFEEAMKRANISNFSFHKIRNTSASYMIQSGVPLYTVGTVLNHKNPARITPIYAHLQTENLRDALEVLARRLEK
jgi:integrase